MDKFGVATLPGNLEIDNLGKIYIYINKYYIKYLRKKVLQFFTRLDEGAPAWDQKNLLI